MPKPDETTPSVPNLPLIYVSGRYRADSFLEILENIYGAWHDAAEIWRMGACVICPHMNTAGFSEIFGKNALISGEQCIQGDLVMISRCDAIYMRAGWQESKGANVELRFAIEHRIPVYYGLGILADDIANHTIGKRTPCVGETPPPKRNSNEQPVQSWTDLTAEVHRKDRENKARIDSQKVSGNPKDVHGRRKAQLHLVPESANIAEAEVMKHGADKYGAYNWRKDAVKASVYVSALRRHMAAWFEGEENDTESGFSHLAHARANLGILLDAQNCGMLIDDRPTGENHEHQAAH